MTPEIAFDRESHEYRIDGVEVPGVTKILRPLNNFGSIPPERLHNAALRGIEVHRLCEVYDRGETDVCDEALIPYVSAWVKFCEDTGFTPDAIEEQIYHPVYSYCGTLDRVGVLYGARAVVDIKTSVALSPVTGLQLAAYQAAWNHQRPIAGRAVQRYAVQLKKDGTYVVQEYTDVNDFEVFLACVAVLNWKCRMNR